MDNTNVNYFLRIPDELKLKIFSFLNTFEIISLTQVWKDFSNVAQDRSLFRIIMLYRENRFKTKHLRSILSNKLYKDCITSLNVNCVYWIEKVDLKKCLNLPMLKHFYAIATKLRLIDFNFAQLSKSLIHKEKTLDTIMWEELSLSHKYIKCCYKDVLPLELVLFTSNTINLRKLSINNCLARLGDCAHVKEEQKILFKRRRIAYKTKSKLGEKTLLEKIVSHSSRIDELEIWECEEVMQNKFRLSQDALLSIKNLQHLEKLTLSNLPSYIKGGFLVDVRSVFSFISVSKFCFQIFKNCVNLKSLRISYYETNTTLTNSLCCAMPFAGSLKDLRVHEDTMKVSSILDALCKMPLGSLERLVLSCRTCDNFDTCAILKFLDSNRHLQFLCFVINSSTETFFKHIRSTLKQLQGPDRIFVVLRNMELVPRSFFIPSVHKIEMMQCNSYVSGIDIFNGLANYN
ncbi:hypothetical protein FQA39_LY16357 [Lamprigera yunnana]|nr:hypothetical protein FQA39_LY16357 [Lamprigera yunnana]